MSTRSTKKKSKTKKTAAAPGRPKKKSARRKSKRAPAAPDHGGKREGAGRKPALRRDGTRVHPSHAARPDFRPDHPVLVTLRVVRGVPSLRSRRLLPVVQATLEAAHKDDQFGIVNYEVQRNQVHLLVLADGRDGLTAGMRGLGVRLAIAVNAALERSGQVVDGAYETQEFKSARQARSAFEAAARAEK